MRVKGRSISKTVGWVGMAALGRQEQEDHRKFETKFVYIVSSRLAILGYMLSFRPARTTQGDPVQVTAQQSDGTDWWLLPGQSLSLCVLAQG